MLLRSIYPFSITWCLLFTFSGFASEPVAQPRAEKADKTVIEKAGEIAKDTTEKVAKTLDETRVRREKSSYYVLGSYSPFDLLLPSKYGATLGYVRSADKTWELEYLRGSVAVPFLVKDLGSMTDERVSLIGRSYFGGNSFNLNYGLSYFDFSIQLGDEILNRVTAGSYPSLDLLEIESLGFNVGVGNRWIFSHNIALGVDWISWAQPVYVINKKTDFLNYASNSEDRDNVDKAVKLISYFPRLAFLKVQLGITF